MRKRRGRPIACLGALPDLRSVAAVALGFAFAALPARVAAQDAPKMVIDEDCQAFDIAADNSIVYAVPHMKRIRQLVIERDDISISAGPGRTRRIVEADKFMPIPPTAGYVIDSIAWSPDAQRIAVSMSLQEAPKGFDDKLAKKRGDLDEDNSPLSPVRGPRAIALLDTDGREIKVAGSKTRFIENAVQGAWLADNAQVVYLTGGGPYSITRIRPADGQTSTLFEGHTFNTVIWDAEKNRAFAIGENLGLHKGLTLVQLDLVRETVTEIAHIDSYQGSLSLSPSGKKIGFFEDGDYIDVIDVATGARTARVRTGFGRFEWSPDEQRVLLKRGPVDRSNILFWVGLSDGSFTSILHDLVFHDFRVTPDGKSLAITEPGKRALKLYALP